MAKTVVAGPCKEAVVVVDGGCFWCIAGRLLDGGRLSSNVDTALHLLPFSSFGWVAVNFAYWKTKKNCNRKYIETLSHDIKDILPCFDRPVIHISVFLSVLSDGFWNWNQAMATQSQCHCRLRTNLWLQLSWHLLSFFGRLEWKWKLAEKESKMKNN